MTSYSQLLDVTMKLCQRSRNPIDMRICLAKHTMKSNTQQTRGVVCDITIPVNLIQANFHNSTRQAHISQRIFPPSQNSTRIPSDAWSKMVHDDMRIWMKLEETHALILCIEPPPDSDHKDTRKSMLHNISVFDCDGGGCSLMILVSARIKDTVNWKLPS